MTDLVKPDEITAADSTDLASAFLIQNLGAVEGKNEVRTREKRASDARHQLRDRYKQKARDTYEKLWKACKESEVGHDFVNTDSYGATVGVCRVCSYTGAINVPGRMQSAYMQEERGVANRMNTSLVNALAERMMEIDKEAGLLVWPEADDYLDGKKIDGRKTLFHRLRGRR